MIVIIALGAFGGWIFCCNKLAKIVARWLAYYQNGLKISYEGEKIIIESRDGTLFYKGEHKDERMHGKGKCEATNYKYEGEFSEGELTGFGTFEM